MSEPRPGGPAGPPCPTCARTTRGVRATPVELTDPSGTVTARLDGAVAWRCDDGHVALVDHDLAARLGRATDAQLVTARRRRLRRDDACGACGEPLTLLGRRSETPVVDDTGPSVVTLSPTMPMVRCPACSTEQVPVEPAAALRALLGPLAAATSTPVAPDA